MTTTLIDGGLSTQLETQGVDLKRYPKLWTAGLLTTAKGQLEVLAAHQHYILAGANIILTSSYQICPFMVNAEDLLVASRDLALQAKGTSAAASQVFLSLGPWGATQADGSEYTGDYKELATQDYLFTFHAKRLSMLLQPGQHQSTSVVDGCFNTFAMQPINSSITKTWTCCMEHHTRHRVRRTAVHCPRSNHHPLQARPRPLRCGHDHHHHHHCHHKQALQHLKAVRAMAGCPPKHGLHCRSTPQPPSPWLYPFLNARSVELKRHC